MRNWYALLVDAFIRRGDSIETARASYLVRMLAFTTAKRPDDWDDWYLRETSYHVAAFISARPVSPNVVRSLPFTRSADALHADMVVVREAFVRARAADARRAANARRAADVCLMLNALRHAADAADARRAVIVPDDAADVRLGSGEVW